MEQTTGPAVRRDERLGWLLPGTLAVVARSPVAPRAIGCAAILNGHLPDFFVHRSATSSVAFVLSGSSPVEWKQGKRLSRFVAAPGGFSVTPGGSGHAFCFDRRLECLNVGIEPDRLVEIAEREFRPYGGTVELVPAYQKTTPEIVALGQTFAALVRSPRPGTGLYAETLWTQIALQVLWNFSTLPRPSEVRIERLSDVRVRRVVDYLESSLAEEVSLSDLADLAGLSPNHFLNAFKKATGKTPHRYLTERRLARACELLHNPQIPIASVALAVGFSSQSHFTTVFGRFMGTTPASYRQQVLGLEPGPR